MSHLKLFALILGLATGLGCAAIPAVEFCLMHPDYGQVCVGRKADGTIVVRGAFSDAQAAEIAKWAKGIIGD